MAGYVTCDTKDLDKANGGEDYLRSTLETLAQVRIAQEKIGMANSDKILTLSSYSVCLLFVTQLDIQTFLHCLMFLK